MIDLAIKTGTGFIMDPTPKGALIGATHQLQNRGENLIKKTDFIALAALAGLKYALSQTSLSDYSSIGALSLIGIASLGIGSLFTNIKTPFSIISMGCTSLLYKNSNGTQLASIALLRLANYYLLDLKKRGEFQKARLMKNFIIPIAAIPLLYFITQKDSILPLFGALYEIPNTTDYLILFWMPFMACFFTIEEHTKFGLDPLGICLPYLIVVISEFGKNFFKEKLRYYYDYYVEQRIIDRINRRRTRRIYSAREQMLEWEQHHRYLLERIQGLEILGELDPDRERWMGLEVHLRNYIERIQRLETSGEFNDSDRERISELREGFRNLHREVSELLREGSLRDSHHRDRMEAEANESLVLHRILEQVPDLEPYTCSITQGIALDPCIERTNPMLIYHYPALAQWIEREGTSPSTRTGISARDLILLPKCKEYIEHRIQHLFEELDGSLLNEAQQELDNIRASLDAERSA